MRWRVVKLLRGWLILVMTWHRQVTIKPHQIGHNFWRGTGAVWDCPVDSCGIIHRQVTTWGCGRSMIPYVEISYLKDPLIDGDKSCYRSWLLAHTTTMFHCGLAYIGTGCGYMRPLLTHLHLDKMAVISQTIFSNEFLWMKNFVFWFKFQWHLFLRVQLSITNIGWDNGLAPNRRQAIISTNADPIHWRIYAARGGMSESYPQGNEIIFHGTPKKPCFHVDL